MTRLKPRPLKNRFDEAGSRDLRASAATLALPYPITFIIFAAAGGHTTSRAPAKTPAAGNSLGRGGAEAPEQALCRILDPALDWTEKPICSGWEGEVEQIGRMLF